MRHCISAEVIDWPGGHIVNHFVSSLFDVVFHRIEASLVEGWLDGGIVPFTILLSVRHHPGEATGYPMVEAFEGLEHYLIDSSPSFGAIQEGGLYYSFVEHTRYFWVGVLAG